MGDPLNDDNVILDYDEIEQTENLDKNEESKMKELHMYGNRGNKTFQDLNLNDKLLSAIGKNGFEAPGEVQAQWIPEAIMGVDILCQAKSGMGKTAVFILSTLQALDEKLSPIVLLW